MRLATFNLMHGRSLSDGLVDHARVRLAVAALDADVLALQEVDQNQPRSGHVDLTRVAAQAMGVADDGHRFAATLIGIPGEEYRRAQHDDEPDGEPRYGVGLVSRYPVLSWHVTPLSHAPVRSPVYTPGPGGGLVWLRDEPRVLLAAVVQAPLGPMTVATTHLSFVPGWNVRQLRQACRALMVLPEPRVLLGDLNIPSWTVRGVTRWRALGEVATYPSYQPRVQLDHALAYPRRGLPSVRGVSTPRVPVSDHLPLVIELG
ncbi:MAG TPA: endonuclease/exonuclease/phosphatase family protein [Micromonosporaceae bacterium]